MSKKFVIGVIIIIVLIIGFFLFVNNTEKKEKKNISVVATTGMIGDMVKNIAGDKVDLEVLMGPGVDPHLYKASAGDLTKMENSNIIFYNGLHLEGKMSDVFENMEKIGKETVAISKSLDKKSLILANNSNVHDPHIWFDINLWSQTIINVKQTLIKLDNENKDFYEANYEKYMNMLNNLNEYIIKRSNELDETQKILVTAHDAFTYFGKAYKFKVKGIQGISTSSEAGITDISDLANFIVDNKVKAIFVESSVPKRSIEALQEAVKSRNFKVEIGGELFSDAMGDEGSFEGTFEGMVKHNIDTIVNALK